jgi:hypothetical protein
VKTIKGHYNGDVVVLDEPAPVDHEVDVSVQFPDVDTIPRNEDGTVSIRSGKRFHWLMPRPETDTWEGSVSDEVIRQRREE